MSLRYANPIRFLLIGLLATISVSSRSVLAAPSVKIAPPNGARFLVDQRFDLRVEAIPSTDKIDRIRIQVDGTELKPLTTDFTPKGKIFGYNRRGFSFSKPGMHTISVTATDDSGVTTTTATLEVLDATGRKRSARNIIVLLGDGMGAAHRTAARIVRYGLVAGRPQGFLAMDRLPASGMVTTSSFNAVITDSAPGMACYTTGSHAHNGQEGVYPASFSDPFSFPRVEYLSAYLHRKMGKSLGVVTTADVEDATPAATAIHTGNRSAGQGICDQFFDERERSGLAVLMGGGRRWFLPQKDATGNPTFGSARSEKNDYGPLPADLVSAWNIAPGRIDPNRDLLKDFTAAGFAYAANSTDLKQLTQVAGLDKLLGLFAYGNMNTALDKIAKRRNPSAPGVVDDYHAPDQPMLDEMASAALKVLNRNPKGFFLLIEGAHIDKQSHMMDGDRAIGETIEFDRAVQTCREFAEKDGNTVVVVVADHECSGFSIIGTLDKSPESMQTVPSDAAQLQPSDTPARQGLVNQDAFPAYRILPDGFPETFDPPRKLLIGYGSDGDRFEGWLSRPRPVTDGSLPPDIRKELIAKGYVTSPAEREEKAFGFFIRGQALRSEADHTAADVPISVYCKNAAICNQFIGVQENTDVFFKLIRAVFGGY